MTDWSDHILLSFGDSFTFGDGLLSPPNVKVDNMAIPYKTYATKTKNKSYTKILSDKMNFKGHLNFGIPGGSNSNSIRMLVEFLQQNPELDRSKIFVLFGFTNIFRDTMSYTNANDAKIYRPFTAPQMADTLHKSSVNSKSGEDSYKISSIVFHELKMVYDYLNQIRILKEIVESQNIKYLIFDLVNDFDYSTIKDDPDYDWSLFHLYYPAEEDQARKLNLKFESKIIRNAEEILRCNDLKHRINISEIVQQTHTMFDGTIFEGLDTSIFNLIEYMHYWAIIKHGFLSSDGNPYLKRYISKIDNAHWNEDGHKVAASIIQSWIEQQDYSYLEK